MADKRRDKLTFDKQDGINFETKNPSSNMNINQKSGGNTPSDLGAIKKNSFKNSPSRNNGINSKVRSSFNQPINQSIQQPTQKGNTSKKVVTSRQISRNPVSNNRQVNRFGKNQEQENKQVPSDTKSPKKEEKNENPKNKNPLLNQNNMKGFGKNKATKNPKMNSSAPFLGKGKGFLPAKGKVPSLQGNRLLSSLSQKRSSQKEGTEKKAIVQPQFSLVTLFQAIPIHIKIAIGVGLIGFIVLVILIIAIVTMTSSESGNREMLEEFIEGDYTEEQLCHYLQKNGYISEDEVCQDTKTFQFFTSLKELIEEYETKYQINRFQVNVQLLYETLFYFFADEDFYSRVTKEEMRNLIDASLEEIEETCVVKYYNQETKACTEVKYVYTLYEYSLDKYISYLKYGTSSTHPNYGHATVNVGRNGKSLARKCGTGKNTDYVFAYGIVNTSSSPMSEGSACPGNPVTNEDYEDLEPTYTSLEEMGALGGVPKYSHIYKGEKPSKEPPNKEEVSGEGLGVEIAQYALQFVGNPYVYGGNSLTKGTDCSGFVQLIYKHFNIELPRTSGNQATVGEKVSCSLGSLKPGDLIFYDHPVSHVAMYIGNGKIVHAKSAKTGIVTDKYNYSKKGFNVCRRIVE